MRSFLWKFLEQKRSLWNQNTHGRLTDEACWLLKHLPLCERSPTVTSALLLAKPEDLLIHLEKPTDAKAAVSIVAFTEDLKIETEGAFQSQCSQLLS